MNRRGITLNEVLVAIFVTGLGLMALMTLFPLGALNMSLAIKDDRAAHCAANAAAYLRTVWRQGLASGQPDPAFQQVSQGYGQPVYLDPIGVMTYAAPGSGWVASRNPGIPRMWLNTVVGVQPNGNFQWVPMVPNNPNLAFQYFSLMDDIEFDFNGAPINRYAQLPRETLYTWAIMLRPLPAQQVEPLPQPLGPQQWTPPRPMEFSVVVYNRRGVQPGLNQPAETLYSGVTYNVLNNTITIPNVNAQTTKMHKGSWVLDMSTNIPPFTTVPHAYFYRVDSVYQPGPNSPMTLKVDQPLRGFENVIAPGSTTIPGQVVLMDNVVEVFEKSTLE